MKPLYVPAGAEPGQRMGAALRHLQAIMLDAGYSLTDQEAFAVQVWLTRRRRVAWQTYLLLPPITKDEIDAMLAEHVVVIDPE